MFIFQLYSKMKFDRSADRLGPDVPFSHFKLYFKGLMTRLCNKKFKHFGNLAEFRPGAYAVGCSKISIGSRVVIRPSTMLFADPAKNGAGIVIEDDVLIGSGVHFYVGNHEFRNPNLPIIDQGHSLSQPIIIKKGSWIGANAIILSGVVVGENAVVGAGSIVTKSVEARTVVGGNPAKFIKYIN